jgi:D-alanine transaminase
LRKKLIVFFNYKYLPLEDVKISPFDRGFQFADGAYEVIRLYQKSFFRLDDHINRFRYSLSELKINFKNYDKISEILYKLIELNKYSNTQLTAYIQVTRGAAFPRVHSFPGEEIEPTIFIYLSKFTPRTDAIENGVNIILDDDLRWLRCDIKSISLLPSVLSKQKAVEANAKEAILIRDGLITEGSHTSFFGIKNGELFTHPLNNFVLPGITRKIILEISHRLNITSNETAVEEKNIKSFDEFFIVGTSTDIAPVVQINNWVVADGKPGEITRKIQETFFEITRMPG